MRVKTVGEVTEAALCENIGKVLIPSIVKEHKLTKYAPSKYDHFHEKTYINGFVPKFNTNRLGYSNY